MKIDKVILASNNNSQYLDFWPLVSEAWKRINVEPILIYTGKEKIDLPGNIINFYVEGLDPVFVAQNIRILAPALFPNDNSITADIDDLPLSKSYFIDNVKNVPEHMFVVSFPILVGQLVFVVSAALLTCSILFLKVSIYPHNCCILS